MDELRVFVPVLPQRMLSSNAGDRSRRNPWAVAEAKGELKNDVMEALKGLQPLPTFDRCTADVTLHRSKRKPKLEQCPRCLQAALGGANIDACRCYRPRDVGNIGGEILKPVLDALVWMAVIPDDDFSHLTSVTLRIEIVEALQDEGISVVLHGGI